MNTSVRLIVAVAAGLLWTVADASSNDIYLAEVGTGASTGVDCSNAYPVSFFNEPRNWGAGTNQIGSGTTVHLCGTITEPANSTGLIFQGSGVSGSPITLKFENGAILQA